MTFLPVVERELRVAARRRGTYRGRFWGALIAIVVGAYLVFATGSSGMPVAQQGMIMFNVLSVIVFLYALTAGPRMAADCISEERREGTLGLLFLTDLKGFDVVTGKLAANSLNALYSLLAVLPILALPLLLGGVTLLQVGQMALVQLNTLFLSLAVSVWVSARSRSDRRAIFASVLLVAALAFLPTMEDIVENTWLAKLFESVKFVSPLYALTLTMMRNFTVVVPGFSWDEIWFSLGAVHLLAWMLILIAARKLPQVWQELPVMNWKERWRQRISQWERGSPGRQLAFRRSLLERHPLVWLSLRERWKQYYPWAFFLAICAIWAWGFYGYRDFMLDGMALAMLAFLTHLAFKVWLAVEACTRLAEDRRNGALELILSTPLDAPLYLRGQWLSLLRLFALPVACLLVLEVVVYRLRPLLSHYTNDGETHLLFAVGVVTFVCDLIALGWVGTWLGLKAKNLNRAIMGTLGRVLLLPWLLYGAGFFGYVTYRMVTNRFMEPPGTKTFMLIWAGISLAVNIVFGLLIARYRLKHDFRTVATTLQRD